MRHSAKMDFTSDIVADETLSKRKIFVSSSDSETNDLLDPQEQELLRLQDLKEELLNQRVNKFVELENLQKQLQNTVPLRSKQGIDGGSLEDRNRIDQNANNLLVDLIVMSSQNRASIQDKDIHLDGMNNVNDELKWKYDTLPIMNMNLRLKHLTELTYPDTEISIERLDNDTKQGDQGSIKNNILIHYTFQKFRSNPLTITVSGEIIKDMETQDEQLTSLQFYDVCNWFKLILRSIIPQNFINSFPHAILFFCHEFDRLQFERHELIRFVTNKYGKRLKLVEQSSDAQMQILQLNSLKDIDSLNLQIEFSIGNFNNGSGSNNNNTQNINYYYPQLMIQLKLYQYEQEVSGINDVFIKLINLYGVKTSIQQLIDQIMF